MKMFVIGERVINRLNEVGVIDSINDQYIYVQYHDKLVKLFINAFEKGYIWYENEALRNMTKKMNKDELYDCGRFFYDKGFREEGLKYYKLAGEKGCLDAIIELAQIYEIDDEEESIKWYKLAAENGSDEAICYLSEDIALDYADEPLEWCIKVAEHGVSEAQLYLAEIYRYGTGVEKNLEKSIEWYKLAAEGGNHDAMSELGFMYYRGDGVERDYNEAYYWFKKSGWRDLPYYIHADMNFYVDKYYESAFRLYHAALEQGVEEAGYKIGEMYYYGLGVEQDYNEAFKYLKYYNGEFEDKYFDWAPAKVHYMLSEMYRNGWGVKADKEEADKLFRAAEKGKNY